MLRGIPILAAFVLAGCSVITDVDDLFIALDGGGGDSDSDSDSDGDTDALECDPSVEDWDDQWAWEESDLLAELNEFRESGTSCGTQGYFGPTSPLEMEYHLQCAARVHARWLADHNTTGHDSPGGPLGDTPGERVDNAGYDGTYAGESLTYSTSEAWQVAEAMASTDEHCARFMDPDTNHAGMGYVYDNTTTQYTFWVMVFGQGD